AALSKTLAGIYAIHGDEPLLALEAADAVRAAARKRGFADREVLEPGRTFDWSEFRHALASLSLFGGKKIVELRLPTGKPAARGARVPRRPSGRQSACRAPGSAEARAAGTRRGSQPRRSARRSGERRALRRLYSLRSHACRRLGALRAHHRRPEKRGRSAHP